MIPQSKTSMIMDHNGPFCMHNLVKSSCIGSASTIYQTMMHDPDLEGFRPGFIGHHSIYRHVRDLGMSMKCFSGPHTMELADWGGFFAGVKNLMPSILEEHLARIHLMHSTSDWQS